MRRLGYLLITSAIVGLGAAPAQAAGPVDPYPDPGFYINIIGGGASFPSIAYREVFDCQYHPLGYDNVTGPGPRAINTNCPSAPYGTATGKGYIFVYYAPTGSGNGKSALKANNNNTLTNPISTTIPYTSGQLPNYPYPQSAGYHFSGSDDVWNLADQIAWEAPNGPKSKYGNMIQLPGVGGAVTIVLNGKDGAGSPLNQNGAAVSGSTSSINITRQAMCGIFAGKITTWDNPLLTASNGGVAMGSGQITVVHRFDGSGTNFLFTQALVAQCATVTGPDYNVAGTPTVSYAFPWGDQSVCPALPRGANRVNWPDQFPTVCGSSNPVPTGAAFTNPGVNGSQAQVNQVVNTNGAIGYVSPDFTQPAVPTGPITANLQNEWDVSTNSSGSPTFVAPTLAATAAALSSVTPVFDSTSIGNPLAWSLQGVMPNPTLPAAYPIAGFSWLELYQCYNSGANMPVQIADVLFGLYGSSAVEAIINSNGLVKVPNVWLTEIYNLLGNDNYRPQNTWENNPGNQCVGKVGAT
ncbi:periplasmic binding family protein [Rhodopseudomonas thermotolerans]|uniref:Periplasmic binding family protein n=2 Tax=Rhodopseudomonas TaxID=1073 RepID=A0A336JMH2_9BRAD|nr:MULTISPECIES: substrate-binding domain-containing protein [Rhodopseudomonas]RED35185.1 periplasmic binding family protein [Rhodopseudomonas pentothenatexigens]REG03028.1 periplasmic binding family protein [Rhodopseudomonas thermotolerans]SSW90875.1 periplasmic binding family protein [Rhodopseudomonas pentothenatexigens]